MRLNIAADSSPCQEPGYRTQRSSPEEAEGYPLTGRATSAGRMISKLPERIYEECRLSVSFPDPAFHSFFRIKYAVFVDQKLLLA